MIYDIEIKNWERYNPRKDRKDHSWFRMQNDWFDDPKLFGCDPATKYCYACLLGVIQKHGSEGRITLNVEWFAAKIGLKCPNVQTDLLKFQENHILTITSGHVVTERNHNLELCHTTNERTDERTNESEKKSDTPKKKWKASRDELLQCYALYPRKEKRAKYLQRAATLFKTVKDLQDFKVAIEKYSAHLIEKDTQKEFVMLITTFLTDWKDWLQKDNGTTNIEEKKKKEVWVDLRTDAEKAKPDYR